MNVDASTSCTVFLFVCFDPDPVCSFFSQWQSPAPFSLNFSGPKTIPSSPAFYFHPLSLTLLIAYRYCSSHEQHTFIQHSSSLLTHTLTPVNSLQQKPYLHDTSAQHAAKGRARPLHCHCPLHLLWNHSLDKLCHVRKQANIAMKNSRNRLLMKQAKCTIQGQQLLILLSHLTSLL